MSRSFNFAEQKLYKVIDKIEDHALAIELICAIQELVEEAKYAGKPRDVLDMD